jgi:hypothetical protein
MKAAAWIQILRRCGLLVALISLALPVRSPAGPPFLTDDPEPVDFKKWEVYLFGQGDRTSNSDAISGPAAEVMVWLQTFNSIWYRQLRAQRRQAPAGDQDMATPKSENSPAQSFSR